MSSGSLAVPPLEKVWKSTYCAVVMLVKSLVGMRTKSPEMTREGALMGGQSWRRKSVAAALAEYSLSGSARTASGVVPSRSAMMRTCLSMSSASLWRTASMSR